MLVIGLTLVEGFLFKFYFFLILVQIFCSIHLNWHTLLPNHFWQDLDMGALCRVIEGLDDQVLRWKNFLQVKSYTKQFALVFRYADDVILANLWFCLSYWFILRRNDNFPYFLCATATAH